MRVMRWELGVRSLVVILLIGIAPSLYAQSADSVTAPIDDYRHFIMPSAKPIKGGYAGFWELAFLQGGVGLGDMISISGGFTILPTVAFRSQIAFLQAKATLAEEEGVSFAAGVNLLRLTSQYFYVHPFLAATVEMQNEIRYTGLLFIKASGDNYPTVNIAPYGEFGFSYGSLLGAGIGFDAPIKGITDTRFVTEIWNHDLSVPNKLALLVSVRIEGKHLSSDFGIMYFTLPLLTPVANFVWRF
jgi:hypothetical protein